ncbi:MAG: hypothetical protein AAF532_13955 [Planctomycetota bacterium]
MSAVTAAVRYVVATFAALSIGEVFRYNRGRFTKISDDQACDTTFPGDAKVHPFRDSTQVEREVAGEGPPPDSLDVDTVDLDSLDAETLAAIAESEGLDWTGDEDELRARIAAHRMGATIDDQIGDDVESVETEDEPETESEVASPEGDPEVADGGPTADATPSEPIDLDDLLKGELVEIAERHGVDSDGLKAEILARLKEAFGTDKYDPVALQPWVEPDADEE